MIPSKDTAWGKAARLQFCLMIDSKSWNSKQQNSAIGLLLEIVNLWFYKDDAKQNVF